MPPRVGKRGAAPKGLKLRTKVVDWLPLGETTRTPVVAGAPAVAPVPVVAAATGVSVLVGAGEVAASPGPRGGNAVGWAATGAGGGSAPPPHSTHLGDAQTVRVRSRQDRLG